MPLYPTYRISRTDAGNAELSKPTNGLSIGQRKLLTFLDTEQAIGALLASRDLDPGKFERDLAKLRSLKLVDIPGMPPEPPVTVTRPGTRAAPARAPRSPATGPVTAGSSPVAPGTPGSTHAGTPTIPGATAHAPVVLGGGRPASSVRLWVFGLAFVAAGALAYLMFATPSTDHATLGTSAAPTQATAEPPPAVTAAAPSQIPSTALSAAPSAARSPAPSAAALTAPLALAAATPPPQTSASAPAEALRPVATTDTERSGSNNASRPTERVAEARPAPRAETPDKAADSRAVPPPSASPAPSPTDAAQRTSAAPARAPAAPVMAIPVAATSATLPTAAPSTLAPGSAHALAEPTLAQPPMRLAAAAPSAAVAHPPAATAKPALDELTPLSREKPDFPREAIAAGVTKGTVKARITVDAAGKVSSVSILDAQPRRVFDRAVSEALSQWTFNRGAASRSTDVIISFDRD